MIYFTYNHFVKIIFFTLLAILLGSCTATRTLVSNQSWIENLQREFDERTYVTDQGSGSSISEARDRAIQNLTMRMIADVRTMSITSSNISERNEIQSGNRTDIVIIAHTHESETNIFTNVKLIGLEIQVSPIQDDGMYYAFVYMERRQSADRYIDMINNNVSFIISLIDDARSSIGQFLAIQRFREATELAYETDMLYTIYGILNPTVTIPRPIYGDYRNATEVRIASDEMSRNFAIRVNVRGDEDGRIQKAFAEVLNSKGIRTAQSGTNMISLDASIELQDVESDNPNFAYIRYIVNYSLRDPSGSEIFSKTISDRVQHRNTSEARNRAIQMIELSIRSDGFSSDLTDNISRL